MKRPNLADLLGAECDDEGRAVGFGVGKEAALREWRFRRDQRRFDRQCAVLRASAWNRENVERRRETQRRWYERNAEQISGELAAKTTAEVHRCQREGCEVEWCRLPHLSGRPRRYCSRACERKANYVPRRER